MGAAPRHLPSHRSSMWESHVGHDKGLREHQKQRKASGVDAYARLWPIKNHRVLHRPVVLGIADVGHSEYTGDDGSLAARRASVRSPFPPVVSSREPLPRAQYPGCCDMVQHGWSVSTLLRHDGCREEGSNWLGPTQAAFPDHPPTLQSCHETDKATDHWRSAKDP